MKRLSIDDNITSIIGNQPLASAIYDSVVSALQCSFVHLVEGKTVWDIFEHSLNTAIRDIEEHPRGKLFRRLIEYGPHNPDEPEVLISDDRTILSDPECGLCVEFIYSHMVNRFKGELSELLALSPCLTLVQKLQQSGELPPGVNLYWGDMVQERRQKRMVSKEANAQWGNFTKGADGLIVERIPAQQENQKNLLKMHGVVEVKSMTLSRKKVLAQINRHIVRLGGGVKVGEKEWAPDDICFSQFKDSDPGLIRVMILPSAWKLSRKWHSVKTDQGRAMVFPEPTDPPTQTSIKKLEPNLWSITLSWSQEALSQAAYELTFWYMSQVVRLRGGKLL